MKFSKSILFCCLCLLAGYQVSAQSLVGTWELHEIDFELGPSLEDEEFGEGDDFESTDEATEIPETITFNEDGTCTLFYWAYYTDEEDEEEEYVDDDDELIMTGIEVSGTWKFDGSNITIKEDDLEVEWYLTNVQFGDGFFRCGFSLLDFTWGIEALEYGSE